MWIYVYSLPWSMSTQTFILKFVLLSLANFCQPNELISRIVQLCGNDCNRKNNSVQITNTAQHNICRFLHNNTKRIYPTFKNIVYWIEIETMRVIPSTCISFSILNIIGYINFGNKVYFISVDNIIPYIILIMKKTHNILDFSYHPTRGSKRKYIGSK